MRTRSLLVSSLVATAGIGLLPSVGTAAGPYAQPPDKPVILQPKGEVAEESAGEDGEGRQKLLDAYYTTNLLAGDEELSLTDAARMRLKASKDARKIGRTSMLDTKGGEWQNVGPDPITQVMRTSNSFGSMSGRVGALAVRDDGTIILGGAQGGVWTRGPSDTSWTSRTDSSDTQAVGALAIAPSDDSVVYMGSGEGALSGDSYYGDGVYRSTDGGATWSHVSSLFTGQAVSSMIVDPEDADHVYAATLRGRGGVRRVTSPTDAKYGVYESTDGGSHWTLRKGTTNEFRGATDLVADPQHPEHLWASFWGDAIYRSTDGGSHWTKAMDGLPNGNFADSASRFALGIAHPAGDDEPTLYTGFDYIADNGVQVPATIWKSVGGTHWTDATGSPTSGSESVVDYCGTQCFYDNVVKPDPDNPDIVYVGGSYGYGNSPQSGGIYRTLDGGANWLNVGYDMHPDYHAIAFQPTDTKHVVIGNDGGAWQSHDSGGRLGSGDPLSSVDWQNLNGGGLTIGQFTSVGTFPGGPGKYWGGTQDNGTLQSFGSNWYDMSSGDGGQVIVDQTTTNPIYGPTTPAYVYGTYYGISPYRYDPSEQFSIFGNEYIDGGIDLSDRSEFYIPWVPNRGDTNQLFLGTYRLYRTDNAKAPSAGDVTWAPISGDLTTGCTGTAPNGARGCLISAIGVADGGDAVWVGTDDARLWVSPNAVSSDDPTWTKAGKGVLPNRPVTSIAVDRSNWRIAYVSVGGFKAGTPGKPGHVFATTDGKHFRNVSGNLPDAPVNSVVMDPSDSRVIYVGTDVGTFVSFDAGRRYYRLGTGMPKVATWQLDYDATNGVLAAATHGRAVYTLQSDAQTPALVVSKVDSGKPVGAGSQIDYTISVKNVGSADATGVTITDRLPKYTSFVSADDGGTYHHKAVRWSGLSVAAGETVDVHFSVRIKSHLKPNSSGIVNDDIVVTSAEGVRATGSPHTTPIAPDYRVAETPGSQSGGAKSGESETYKVHVANTGYLDDSYTVAASGSWTSALYESDCTTPLGGAVSVASGGTADVCVQVDVPSTGVAEGDSDTTTVTATSEADSSVTASATLTTYAAVDDTLLVDGDGDGPDVSSYYKAAMGSTPYGYWDLGTNAEIPVGYLTGHKNVVWWTGNAYPGPISPYESELTALLDGGGRLFMSGQDILDQAAGTTSFVHDYLHISWDGSETQNDLQTAYVTGVGGNPVSGSIGQVTIDHSVLGATYEDEITPINGAQPAFTDDANETDALSVGPGDDPSIGYKVVFLAFPFEAMSTDQETLMQASLTWFGS